jgi:hypothetical protein
MPNDNIPTGIKRHFNGISMAPEDISMGIEILSLGNKLPKH